jgi:drug/metabolite transporter (DMT)-like permease
MSERSERRKGRLYVALAAVAWSLAGLLQRGLTVNIPTQLSGRAFFAVIATFSFVAFTERGRTVQAFRAIGRIGIVIAALMSVATGCFIVALNYASVANVLFLQALAPILAALLASAFGERVARRTWVAMAIAVVGVAVMIGGPGHPSGVGLGLSLAVTVSFAILTVLTRHHREVSMAPASCLSQLIVFVLAAPFAAPGAIGTKDLFLLVAMGFGPLGVGLVCLTIGGRLLPAAEVALITLLEIVLGPLWVWLAYSERPGTATIVGGVIVLAAVVYEAMAAPEPPPAPI